MQYNPPKGGVPMALSVVPEVQRVRQQLRRLNDAYGEADDKIELRSLIVAKLHELEMIHTLLPDGLKPKSWLLEIERYDQWTANA